MPKSFESSAQVECAGGESLVSQFDEGLWQKWPSPSKEICFWHYYSSGIIASYNDKLICRGQKFLWHNLPKSEGVHRWSGQVESRWFPNLTRAYGNNGRRPRQKYVFGIITALVLLHLITTN